VGVQFAPTRLRIVVVTPRQDVDTPQSGPPAISSMDMPLNSDTGPGARAARADGWSEATAWAFPPQTRRVPIRSGDGGVGRATEGGPCVP